MPTTLSTVWNIADPPAWPEPSRWMSFSALLEIESCPRLWSLRSAQYPSVWSRRGYPRLLDPAPTEGTIVHSAIERITCELAKRGCSSTADGGAIAVLKEMGGFSKVVKDCTDHLLQQHEDNPRAQATLESVRRRLEARLPEMRSRVQRHISRIRPQSRQPAPLSAPPEGKRDTRYPLTTGSHPEVELRSLEMGWHGFVDLLTLSDSTCEIRDFKTGAAKEQHELQLRIYALLWARDRELNPSGRLADRLVVSYDDREVTVPAPTAELLNSLELETATRTATARALLVTSQRPEARPSATTCAHCMVRQLCAEYWDWLGEQNIDADLGTSRFADLEIDIRRRHGPSSWDGAVLKGSTVGRSVVLRTSSQGLALQSGDRVRVLNVCVSGDSTPQQQPLVATTGANSEVFFIR